MEESLSFTKPTSFLVDITLVRVSIANRRKEWKADAAKLEAILSLAELTRSLDETHWRKRMKKGEIKNSGNSECRDGSDADMAFHDRALMSSRGCLPFFFFIAPYSYS